MLIRVVCHRTETAHLKKSDSTITNISPRCEDVTTMTTMEMNLMRRQKMLKLNAGRNALVAHVPNDESSDVPLLKNSFQDVGCAIRRTIGRKILEMYYRDVSCQTCSMSLSMLETKLVLNSA
ncbi:hypothetical protein B9Z55_027672 [Caenorhabditis nigoni]|uniref:Uncharacterized protein n=1 Tax=Caenorhabditis nigoni TaxID=1611254 RepID=A0A2G5SF80_9PELO|nr:hypothetical protein B9Z55_027672 [Caenorhabditis nigoni]